MLISIFSIIFIILLFILFLLPYDIGIRVEKENGSVLYSIFVASWKSMVGFEWRREDQRQYMQFIILGRVFHKKVSQQKPIQNKQFNRKSDTQKKNKVKKRRVFCIITNTVMKSPKWLLRLMGILHFKTLEIIGYLGMHDPACTGVVYGLMQSLYPLNLDYVHISVTPNFYKRKYEGSINLEFQLFFFQLIRYLLHLGIRFLWIFGRCHFKMKGRLAW